MKKPDKDTVQKEFSKAIILAAEKSVPRGYCAKFKEFLTGEMDAAVNKRKKATKPNLMIKRPITYCLPFSVELFFPPPLSCHVPLWPVSSVHFSVCGNLSNSH